jgi:carbon storage regulator
MLVLTRKVRQSIMIGDDVEVTVVSTDGTKVRLGIQAPTEIPVHRTEIYLEIQSQGRDGAIVEPVEQAQAGQRRAG